MFYTLYILNVIDWFAIFMVTVFVQIEPYLKGVWPTVTLHIIILVGIWLYNLDYLLTSFTILLAALYLYYIACFLHMFVYFFIAESSYKIFLLFFMRIGLIINQLSINQLSINQSIWNLNLTFLNFWTWTSNFLLLVLF